MKGNYPSNWYWMVVASGDATVWSSAKASFVQIGDPDYMEFLSSGLLPSRIASLEELTQVFAEQFPAGMLQIYANAKQWEKATGGYLATVDGVVITIPTSVESMSLIGDKAQRLLMPNAPMSVNWQIGPTSFVDMSTTDFISIAVKVADFVQSTFDILKVVLDDIQSGKITTILQIDERFS